MITREQVADLREGDVVELGFSTGTVIRGPLAEDRHTGDLDIAEAGWTVQRRDGSLPYGLERIAETLTVVSRAPRLYVNHPRTAPAPGDTAHPGDGTSSVAFHTVAGWVWPNGTRARVGGHGLRLLVDGETGQVVP